MATSYTLTKSALEQLRKDHHQLRTQLQALAPSIIRASRRTPMRDDLLIGKATEAVAGRSGANLSSGSFTVQELSGAGVLTDTAKTHTVFNIGEEDISSGDYFPLERDYKSSRWVARKPAAGGGGGGGSTTDVVYVKAQEYWQHGVNYPSAGGGMGWVGVKKCDRDGTGETGAEFDCYLPVPENTDPNVITDQVFAAVEITDQSDSATSWAAVSDVSDAPIGTVRMITGNAPTAAQGWAEMDGAQDDTKTASGTAINMAGRVPLAGTPGTAAGTVSPSATTSSTTPDTVTTSSVAAAVSISGASANTSTVETGIESTDSEIAGTITATSDTLNHDSAGPDMTDVVTEVTDDGLDHTHQITDPGHQHEVTVSVTGTADAHTHTVPGDPHTHDIELQATMTLSFYERIDNSNYA